MNVPLILGWFGSQWIVQLGLVRYLVLNQIPALYASQFFIRLACLALMIGIMIYKIITLSHATLNSPYSIGRLFKFSLWLVFVSSMFEFGVIILSIQALQYYSVIHFLALFHIFIVFFRSLINNVSPGAVLVAFLIMGLVYLLEDWIILVDGSSFQNKTLGIRQSFDWQPLLMVIGAAACKTLAVWGYKVKQMKTHLQEKAFMDRVAWANYIADEPERIASQLCVVNNLFVRYIEAQLRIHCQQNSRDIDQLNYTEIRTLINEYFHNQLSYSYHYMENFVFNFNQEAVDDPEAYQEDNTLLRRLIRESVYMMQLNNQQYKDLFGNDKYENLNFEILFEDYGLLEYIWDSDTPILQICKYAFEALFCFVGAFYNGEQYSDFFGSGFYLNYNISDVNYYVWIAVFLGVILAIRPLQKIPQFSTYRLIFIWEPTTYFFMDLTAEVVIAYCIMIWIEDQTYLQILGLILSYLVKGIVYRSASRIQEQKEKLFYLTFVQFLVRVQKFTHREGAQIIAMLTLCAEKLNLSQFIKIYSQVLCTHGIVSPDQLRHIKFSHYGEMPFFQHSIPFIFQSQLRYENNIEHNAIVNTEHEEEQQQQDQFQRYIIKSAYQQVKSQIHQEIQQQIQSRIVNNDPQ